MRCRGEGSGDVRVREGIVGVMERERERERERE